MPSVQAEYRTSFKLNNIRGYGLYNYTQTIWKPKDPNNKLTIDWLVDCKAGKAASFNVRNGGFNVVDVSTIKTISDLCISKGH